MGSNLGEYRFSTKFAKWKQKVAKWKQKNGIFRPFNKNDCIIVSLIEETRNSQNGNKSSKMETKNQNFRHLK